MVPFCGLFFIDKYWLCVEKFVLQPLKSSIERGINCIYWYRSFKSFLHVYFLPFLVWISLISWFSSTVYVTLNFNFAVLLTFFFNFGRRLKIEEKSSAFFAGSDSNFEPEIKFSILKTLSYFSGEAFTKILLNHHLSLFYMILPPLIFCGWILQDSVLLSSFWISCFP